MTTDKNGGEVNIVFRDNGTAIQSGQAFGHIVIGHYDYSTTGDHLTETLTAAEMDGKPIKVSGVERPRVEYRFLVTGDNLTLKPSSAEREMLLTRVK